ncbi:MAG: ABC transporter permease subunit [Chloroflexi bacterium]|nr:ABC transporter permease subunit [Chloroflexota bacterium]MBK6710826.1 ABC transporter permease subunit [Chloroflexota bacterium]MBK7176510.1 ABC transporter permease subunit [Chloroflexota bacterium]MBK8933956.1 ABC transporter permease subunit [Chloroflexota bacterium]
MTTWIQSLQERVGNGREFHFDSGRFIRENITKSWLFTLWLIILTYLTLAYTISQFRSLPFTTGVLVLAWLLTVSLTVYNEITRSHNTLTLWLRNNLYSSITNTLLSLLLVLAIVAAVWGFIDYAFLRASFTRVPEEAQAILAQFDSPGANWGAVLDNMRNLMVFRYPKEDSWRLWFVILYMGALLAASTFVFSQERFRRHRIRQALTGIWLATPVLTFMLLLGVKPVPGRTVDFLIRLLAVLAGLVALFFLSRGLLKRFPSLIVSFLVTVLWAAAAVTAVYLLRGTLVAGLNPDIAWGGLLLTLIIAVFAIVASFPLGVLLALGRRSQIRGIPPWLTYSTAAVFTAYYLYTNTLPAFAAATTIVQQLFSLWPLLFLVIAYLFQKYFKGNVVALFCTFYIEGIRGVPLITVLFMSIILFPILLPKGMEILSTWRVMAAAALFAAAYLAENVRGGLQSIPKGQYEAADAIGLNTFQKYRLIILPQAIRTVIPAIVGQFIGLFKDTTLIAIVGLVELLGVANLISAQTDWLGVRREPYIFLMLIYFTGSWVMATSSRRLEKRMGVGER